MRASMIAIGLRLSRVAWLHLGFLAAKTRQKASEMRSRGTRIWPRGAVGNFLYRQVLGLVALLSSQQAILEVDVLGSVLA